MDTRNTIYFFLLSTNQAKGQKLINRSGYVFGCSNLSSLFLYRTSTGGPEEQVYILKLRQEKGLNHLVFSELCSQCLYLLHQVLNQSAIIFGILPCYAAQKQRTKHKPTPQDAANTDGHGRELRLR